LEFQMENFSPVSASIGGALIGLSAALLWLGNGRIAGISGIFGQLLPPGRTVVWRFVFLASLVGGTFLAALLFPALGNAPQLAMPPAWFGNGAPVWTVTWIAVAGLLTGFGTKIGNGCTSGHGICGLARLSVRSATAVAIFFGVAAIVVMVTGIAR
jgi:uncharacterized membrane protein YedE/YeeE